MTLNHTNWYDLTMLQLSSLSLQILKDALNKRTAKKLSEYFDQPVFRTSDTEISYRRINELDSFNLAKNQRENDKGWRKFSANEVVKLQIADKLGSFGFTKSNDIKDVIDFLDANKVKICDNNDKLLFELSILDTANILSMADVATFLLVNKENVVAFVDADYYSMHLQSIATRDILTIALPIILDSTNEKFKKLIDKKKMKNLIYSPISENELALIKLIRSNDYSRIELKLGQGGGFDMVQATNITTIEKGQRSPSQLIKLIQAQRGFGEINLIKEDGQVIAVKQIDRHKVSTRKK